MNALLNYPGAKWSMAQEIRHIKYHSKQWDKDTKKHEREVMDDLRRHGLFGEVSD